MTVELDTKGLRCPLPVLKARKTMKSMAPGEEIRVLATDPSAVKDFEAFCEALGHTLLDSSESGGVYSFLIRKSA
jgi:tRNA 2-thiouridine synthesizing protein A